MAGMTPKSRRTRFIYFIIFTLVFIAAAPFVLLYSLGYNWGENFSLLKTGGIYVYASQNNVGVYVNDKLDDTTSTFQHGILVKDLHPNSYSIKVTKDGYLDWKKTIRVNEERVAEAYPFLIPRQITATSVPSQIPKTNATTSVLVANTEYKSLLSLFATSTADVVSKSVITALNSKASSTFFTASSSLIESKKVVIVKEGNDLHAIWTGSVEDTPFYFCLNEKNVCNNDFIVYSAPSIDSFNFYPSRNDVIIVTVDSKLLVVELDKRAPQNIVELYQSKAPDALDFKVFDNETLIVKEGKKLTKLSLVYAAQ